MMTQIKNLSIGDKFTETGLLAVSTKILTVEKFTFCGLIIARDEHGRTRSFNENEMIFPLRVRKSSS